MTSIGAIWDTALQQTIAPDKLARVSAYNWMAAMPFSPAATQSRGRWRA
jgi:hypothetical protein